MANIEQSVYCEIVLGWAKVLQGDYAGGIAEMETGVATWPPDGHRYYFIHCVSLLADACYRDGRFEIGIHLLQQALENPNLSSEQWWEAEIHRLLGQGYLLTNDGREDSARECFQKALEVARGQGAKMLELRASTDLSRLLRDQGELQEALDLLAPVYEWFTEGFEGADLLHRSDQLIQIRRHPFAQFILRPLLHHTFVRCRDLEWPAFFRQRFSLVDQAHFR